MVAHGFDMHGEPLASRARELLARAIQHETDHLDGILFIDRLDREARKAAMKDDPRVGVVRRRRPQVKFSPARHQRARLLA